MLFIVEPGNEAVAPAVFAMRPYRKSMLVHSHPGSKPHHSMISKITPAPTSHGSNRLVTILASRKYNGKVWKYIHEIIAVPNTAASDTHRYPVKAYSILWRGAIGFKSPESRSIAATAANDS